MIKAIRKEEKNILTKVLFEKNFEKNYRSIVVLANPKTVLNDKFAKKEIKSQVIRADQLVEYIKAMDKDNDTETMAEKQMEALAKFFADRHQSNPTDYTLKYRGMLKETDKKPETISDTQESGTKEEILKCPKCGAEMVLRTAKKGDNSGKKFYGCSRYPKCRGIINIQYANL